MYSSYSCVCSGETASSAHVQKAILAIIVPVEDIPFSAERRLIRACNSVCRALHEVGESIHGENMSAAGRQWPRIIRFAMPEIGPRCEPSVKKLFADGSHLFRITSVWLNSNKSNGWNDLASIMRE